MKKLVAYFSATGTTARVAARLAAAEDADLLEIRPQAAYTPADLDWTDPDSRSSREMKDLDGRPALALLPDLSGYDEIFAGFPVWWGLAPTVIDTFLDQAVRAGCRVIPFATSGGSGIEKAQRHLEAVHPALWFEKGRLLPDGMSEGQLAAWADRFQD